MSESAQDQRVRIDGSPVRCPYCHDDIDPAHSEWVACAGCLARHHQACWDEAHSCSACGAGDSLIRVKATERAVRLSPSGEDTRETAPHPLAGGPLQLLLERTFDGEATIEDAAWLDATVRRALKVKGRVSLEGRSLVWRPHGDNGCKSTTLRVSLVSGAGRTTLRIEEDLRSALVGMFMGALGVTLTSAAILGNLGPQPLLLLLPLLGVLAFAVHMLFHQYGERRERRLDDLLGRLTDGLTWSPHPRRLDTAPRPDLKAPPE